MQPALRPDHKLAQLASAFHPRRHGQPKQNLVETKPLSSCPKE
jgi:hypothetical protein